MADRTAKAAENIDGMFYCDESCIDCGACRGTAPEFFMDGGGHSYVGKQPISESDVALCHEALNGCPVGAIGDDGE
ncbi:ferredoxin [Candidatus Sumerlaeota bacterium]|nr:ferredoxin [Candidatus Sumerlaeales bacterium]NLD61169.1 ferredoxin [Candidatus Sumerlaeota bacterium]